MKLLPIEPSFKFTTAKKKDTFEVVNPENPSPSAYNNNKIFKKGQKGQKMATSVRIDYSKFNTNPGVGSYKVETDINKSII